MDANIARQRSNEADKSKVQSTTEQLLSLSAMSSSLPGDFTTTHEIDAAGAKACKTHVRILAAIVAEGFYAVHSKAQRRVPLPEGIDMHKPLNASALSALQAVEITEVPSFSALTFTTAPSRSFGGSSGPSGGGSYFNAYDPANKGGSRDEEDAKIAKLAANWGDEGGSAAGGGTGAGGGAGSASRRTAYEPVRNPESSLFYLGGGKAAAGGASALAASLAEFEDTGKKSRKKVGVQVMVSALDFDE